MNTKRIECIRVIIATIMLFALTHFSTDVITLTAPVSVAYAQPGEESILIQPFRWVESQTIYSDQDLVFTIGWAACQNGLVQDYLNAVNLAFTLDGQPVFASKAETNQFWEPVQEIPAGPGAEACVGTSPETIWQSNWVFHYGNLAAGDHTVYFANRLDHPLTDGGDYNQDGSPDFFEGTLREREFIIHVEDRPVDHPATVEIQPFRWDAGQTVYSDQEIVFTLGWGACKQGQVQDYLRAVNLVFQIDGQALFASQKDANLYWGPVLEIAAGPGAAACVGSTPETIWKSDWRYPFGKLQAGDYTVYFVHQLDHPVIDGGDYDGDGSPDIFQGVLREREFVIHVEDPAQ